MLPASLYAILSSTYGPYVPPAVTETVISFNNLASLITNSNGYEMNGNEFISQGIRFVGNPGYLTLFAFDSTKGNIVSLPPSQDNSVFLVGLDYRIEFLTGFDFTKLKLNMISQQGNSLQGNLFGASGSMTISYPAGGADTWLNDVTLATGTIGRLDRLVFGSNAFVGIDHLVLS